MSHASRQAMVSRRYQLTKLWSAAEECVHHLLGGPRAASVAASSAHQHHHQQQQQQRQQPPSSASLSESLGEAVAKFRDTYNQRMTSVVHLAGSAMAPALNKAALEERDAVEKLVVRHIPRPSARTVLVGDVVAFTPPALPSSGGAAAEDDAGVAMMVRRVAALEGDELVAVGGARASSSSSSSGAGGEAEQAQEEVLEVPQGHCWVLADNESAKPAQAVDSRTFGYMPLTNIVGRVIYAASSRRDHSPVMNNPASVVADQGVIEGEVDIDKLHPSI